MIKRKTTRNRKCPHCSETALDRLFGDEEDDFRKSLECPKCGDVTKDYVTKEMKRLWAKELEDTVPKSIFVSFWVKDLVYLSCVNCLTVYTHPRSYCCYCNGITERRKVSITIGEWLKRSPNKKEFRNRFSRLHFGTIWFDWCYPDLSNDEKIDKRLEILELTT